MKIFDSKFEKFFKDVLYMYLQISIKQIDILHKISLTNLTR